MNNVVTRSLSGIIYIAVIVGAILGGGWWFYLLTLVFCVTATFEYQHLCEAKTGHFTSAPSGAHNHYPPGRHHDLRGPSPCTDTCAS